MGRLHPRKGIDVLIRAFGKAAGQLGQAHLVIAGRGRELQHLERLAEQSGSDRIHFLGSVAGDAKRWLLQNAKFLVAPTRTWEGMPVVVLEALACGRPIVGSNVGGIVDLVIPGQTGVLVEPEDADGLAAAMEKLSADPQQLATLSRGALELIRPYDWSVVAKQYLDLFDSLLSSRDSNPHTAPSAPSESGDRAQRRRASR